MRQKVKDLETQIKGNKTFSDVPQLNLNNNQGHPTGEAKSYTNSNSSRSTRRQRK